MDRLPFRSALDRYQAQAVQLLNLDSEALHIFHENHPRFLDQKITWLPLKVSDDEIRNSGLELADAQLALARWYSFRDWAALEEYAAYAPSSNFEAAVEAVIDGDLTALQVLLQADPELPK